LFAHSLDSLRQHEQVQVGERLLTIAEVKQSGAAAVVRFADVGDRNAAEALRGQLITVPRSALPPLEEGEYYHADLIGMRCEDNQGVLLGSVVTVENFGAGDIIEIEKPDGKRAMVPLRAGVADLEASRIVVDPLFLA
jgi:16S rRNA processing protein RimM